MADKSVLGEVIQMAEDTMVNAQGTAPDASVGMAQQPQPPVQVVAQTAPPVVAQLAVPAPQPVVDEVDPTEVKPSWIWIRDSKGMGSVTATFAFIAFWCTTICYILSMFDKIGPISIRPFDVAACSAYFIPCLTALLGKHVVDAKFGSPTTGA